MKQQSLFYWHDAEKKVYFNPGGGGHGIHPEKTWSSAFTSQELGELLPIEIKSKQKGISSGLLEIRKGHFGYPGEVKWQVMYHDEHFENADTEADARGAMLVYLLKNGLYRV